MTLRTKEAPHSLDLNQVFSDLILSQESHAEKDLDLRSAAPIFRFLHPRVIRALLSFMEDPLRSPERVEIQGIYFSCYSGSKEAKQAHPDLIEKTGAPFSVSEFLSSTEQMALFNFFTLGSAVLSKSAPLQQGPGGLHDHLLPPFLFYALGPELWGLQGKWTRFHQRLHGQFAKHNLLTGPVLPGRYPLEASAQRLEQHGIHGTLEGNQYMITLPWTFSLSSLERLERILEQEF